MNDSLEKQIVFFTVMGNVSFGDMDGCATVELIRGRGGWYVAAGPTRHHGPRPVSIWVDAQGRRRLYPTSALAMAAVQMERPGETLRWCQKIRQKPPVELF